MRELLLLPVIVVSTAMLLPLVLLGAVFIGILMWVLEKQGLMKLGGLHRDTQEIGIWH